MDRNEAIRRIRAWNIDSDDMEVLAEVIPELKESEDERIRKGLIKSVSRIFMGNKLFDTDVTREEALAWLEKQATPQVRTGIEWENTIDDACDKRYAEEYAHGEYCHEQSFRWGFFEGVEWLERQGSQNLANSAKTCKDEQKPAWSEEDDINLGKAIWYIENPAPMVVKDSMLVDWLKSLKSRVQPLRQQEWSEEDENALKVITQVFEVNGVKLLHYPGFVHWLKTLPNRITPQNTWKPSDKQMKASKEACIK